ncbi:MAG: hypothetical protein HC859_09150 [Bacteroidia bacterium]|nr:hypothetical protein [Bacteroidia bacterium]
MRPDQIIKYFFATTALIGASVLLAKAQEKQEPWEDQGKLENVEVEIINQLEIKLPKATRNFEKIPPRPSEPIRPAMTYDFRPFVFNTPEVRPLIRPLKLKQSESASVYGGTLLLGYGNYASPYLEGFINSGRSRNKLVGAHAWLKSSVKGPVGGKNSGSGTSGISLYGRTFSNEISLSGNLGFDNRTTHFYGYPQPMEVSRDTIKQSFNHFTLGGAIENARNSKFAYKLGGDFSYLSDKYDAKETEIDVAFGSSYRISDDQSIEITADYAYISRKDSEVATRGRNLLQMNGGYAFTPLDGVRIRAGVNFAYENDTIDSKDVSSLSGHTRILCAQPVCRRGGFAHRWHAEGIIIKPEPGKLVAGSQRALAHTNKQFDLEVGLKARLGNKVGVHTGLSLASLKNMYFFLNDSTDQAKFQTVYDDKATKRSNFFAALSYAQSEKAKFLLRGDLYSYLTDQLDEPWHKPTYKLSANASYDLYSKLLFSLDLIAQGGMKAYDFTSDKIVTLDGAFDVNFRTEYKFSQSLSFFVQLNNIASNKYPVFLNYPVRGFQVIGGLMWSF